MHQRNLSIWLLFSSLNFTKIVTDIFLCLSPFFLDSLNGVFNKFGVSTITYIYQMSKKPSDFLNYSANLIRKQNRNKRFEEARKQLGNHSQAQIQVGQQLKIQFFELDYLTYYSEEVRSIIVSSLTSPIPEVLPPLDISTISFYRRSNKPLFQTRQYGMVDIDFHMAHQSLHILSEQKREAYPNFGGVTKEFERDFKLYLSSQSKDVRLMAKIAAGNHIIGKEKDVLSLVEEDNTALWVLFNHATAQKISYKALLPYILKGCKLAFEFFYNVSNSTAHEAIDWFFDNEEVVASLLQALSSNNYELKLLSLRIIGNVLGEQKQIYVKTLIYSNFLDIIFPLLSSSDYALRKDTVWVLANFCCEYSAIYILNKPIITQKLIQMLYDEKQVEIRKQVVNCFNFLIEKAREKQLIFQRLMFEGIMQLLASYIQVENIELSIVCFTLILELVVLGNDYRDEGEINVVSKMVQRCTDLVLQIEKGNESSNEQIFDLCHNIKQIMQQTSQMEGEY